MIENAAEILLVEDDPDDAEMFAEILKRGKIPHHLNVVDDGVKALDYLNQRGDYTTSTRPDLIVLDLNLPRKDGRWALREIKSNNNLKSIPAAIFTTSKADSDVTDCYFAGANCYITKPREFVDFVAAVKALETFWFSLVKLPPTPLTAVPFPALPTQAEGNNIRVLLIEDDPEDAEFLQRVLAKEDKLSLSIDVVDNLTSAIEVLRRKKFEIILLDLGLATTAGLDTFETLFPHAQGVPVVVLTGLADETVACEAIRQGAQDYLLKGQPESRAIWRVLRYALERRSFLENLQKAHLQLEDRVRERTEELSETNLRLNREIWERSKAERAAKESEARFKRLADSTFEGLLVHEDHQIIDANRAAATMYGCEESQLLGKNCLDFVEATYRDFAKSKMASNDGRPFETLNLKLNGAAFPAEIQTRSLSGDRGHIQVLAIRDVTERKLIEQMKDRNLALKEANDALEHFASVASHDLKEPLLSIAGFLTLLKKEAHSQLNGSALEYLNIAVDSAKRLHNLVDDLLSYTRHSQASVELAPISTDSVLKDAIANLKDRIGETGAKIQFSSLPKVMGNSFQLVRLFQNLLSNAIKFQKKEVPPQISVSAVRDGDQWIFKVTDNGIGFAQESIEEVFMMFRRLHGPEAYPGTGIGLATCKKIIERHKGRIWAESKEGVGSTFCFGLQAVPSLSLTGVKILVVDDAPNMIVLLKHRLNRWGAEVEIAHNGMVAVEKAALGIYDLIIMDIEMPFLNGIQATEKIRKSGYGGAILAFTGHKKNGNSEFYRDNGFTGYFSKDEFVLDEEGDELSESVAHALSTVRQARV